MKNSTLLLLLMLLFPSALYAQDSDGDGLEDTIEAMFGTEDDDVDTDNDGLGDGYEVVNGSNPLLKDSDGGGDWDSVELANGRNPNDPNDDIGVLAGIGPVVQFVRRTSSISSFTSAEVTLFTSSLFRGFGWNYPVDLFSAAGEFPGGTDIDLVWGQDVVPSFVATFAGWIHVPTGTAPNTHTFGISCAEGCRFRIWNGSDTEEERHENEDFHNHVEKVTFPEEGGLFPFEVLYYNDGEIPSMELSWAPGDVSFDANIFTPIPSDSIIHPTLRGNHEVHDVNGGNVEVGDVLEIIVRVKNTSNIAAFSVSLAESNSELDNRTITLQPPGSRTFGSILTLPIIDPGQTQEVRFTGVVPVDAPNSFTISIGFGASISSESSHPGRGRIRRWSDDRNVNDGVENGNEPVGLFPNNGLNEDDPTTITIGQSVIVNECTQNPCDPNAQCTDQLAGFRCTCDNGYTGDGFNCTNIDECIDGTNNCSTNATCTDSVGAFECECAPGFLGDGVTCTDIDECGNDSDNCAAEARCTNIDGSFECMCRRGFIGDGLECEDIDECGAGTDNCADVATCENTPGAFTCTCPAGTTGDGTACRTNNCACEASQVCVADLCYDTCAMDSECNGEDLCFDGRCTDDPCKGVMCGDGTQCRGGSCFESCAGDIDCSNPAHACYDQLCTLSPCEGIVCGQSQTCFGGACFNACVENADCQSGESCYDGRCAIEPCRGVICSVGDVCFGGTCFDTCFEDTDCKEGDLCYEGRCTADPCLEISCPTNQVCYGGSCFDTCASDVDCSNPDDLCYDFRCASDVCEGVQCPSSESCVAGFCRITCSPSSPCESGLDCEQGLCVPTTVATGCGCSSGSTAPTSMFWFSILALLGMIFRRKI